MALRPVAPGAVVRAALVTVRIEQGHVISVLAELPAKSVHVCVTSPPYWGLRAYGTPPQVWGGAEGCEHGWGGEGVKSRRGTAAGATAQVGNTQKRVCPPDLPTGAFCGRCGAWRGELGSEPTLDLFVAHLVEVMAAVGRVLRDDGTLWVNLGDSYASKPNSNTSPRAEQGNGSGVFRVPAQHHLDARWEASREKPSYAKSGLKDGDLCMAPARFALAMQAAGWTLRSQIVLPKKAPMPESLSGTDWERHRVKVPGADHAKWKDLLADALERHDGDRTRARKEADEAARKAGWEVWRRIDCPGCDKCRENDLLVQSWGSWRPTSAYEVLYLFSKAGQRYFSDGEAVRMPVSAATLADGRTARGQRGTKGEYGTIDGNAGYNPAGRNLWNYVMWSPEPLAAAHYAAFPRFIPRLAIQAGTSERGACPDCGAPWLRVVERDKHPTRDVEAQRALSAARTGRTDGQVAGPEGMVDATRTVGWRQSCRCPAHSPVPAVCLDPFSGSGTTLIEANALGRHGIGVELLPAYVDIAHKRLSGQPLSLFAQEAAA